MAINRKDYQYVRNTLPGYGKGRTETEDAGGVATRIGDKVKNLLPDLYDGMSVYVQDYRGDTPASFWTVKSADGEGIYTEILLEKKKTYVLQIFNLPSENGYYGEDLEDLKNINNAFMYFTPSEDTNYIFGFDSALATYNRLVYSDNFFVDQDGNGINYQKKTSNGSTQVKIYLFEADQSWFVDNKGVVAGIYPCWLEILE